MIKRIHKGKRFITVTTRKANYTDEIFGKFTSWKSKEDYNKGNCEGTITYRNVPLGIDKNCLETEANKFIDKYII